MRPTNLNFRSPKELTPGPNFPCVVNTGHKLVSSKVPKRSTFGSSKRFGQFGLDERYRVGPGSYENDGTQVSKAHVKGGHLYKGYHGGKPAGEINYYFVGDHMVYDHNMKLVKKKSDSFRAESRVDISVIAKSLQQKSSKRDYSQTVVPWFMKSAKYSNQKNRPFSAGKSNSFFQRRTDSSIQYK